MSRSDQRTDSKVDPPQPPGRQSGLFSKLLHWTIAVLILALVGLGAYMVELSYFDKWYNQSLSLHKSFGLLVFALAGVYFCWKILSPSPTGLTTAPRWQYYKRKMTCCYET